MQDESTFLYHTTCDNCGSSDARAVYSSGSSYCFSCNDSSRGETVSTDSISKPYKKRATMLVSEYKELKARKIPSKICSQYKYGVTVDSNNKTCQVANYYSSEKELIAQKVRYPDKTFQWVGEAKEALLFGQQLFGSGGKKLTITEGELDALSVATAFDGKYPVVSIKSGIASAKKEIAKHLDWITSFEEIYLWFDNDEKGRQGLAEVVQILPASKVKIIRHSEYKDASDVLVHTGVSGVVNAFYNAEDFKPDDIVTPDDLLDDIAEPIEQGFDWCYRKLTQLTYGRRYGEIVCVGAGVSVGKTDFVTSQIAFDIKHDWKVGTFMLEQSKKETLLRIAGKLDGQHYHLPNQTFDKDNLKETVHSMQNKLYMFDNFGSIEWEVIREKIRYMCHNYGVRIFYIDNLTALNAHASDERRNLDALMAEVATLAKELDIWILLVSHLNPPKSGASHEAGGKVEQNQFTGSRAIMRWAFFMMGVERNTLHPDPAERNKGLIRCIKDRFSGRATGHTIGFVYDTDSGLCLETEEEFDIEVTEGDDSDY